MKDIVIIGSGGFSKKAIDIIERKNEEKNEYNLIGLIDDNESLKGNSIMGYEVIGDTSFVQEYSFNRKLHGIIAIADGYVRENISSKLHDIHWENIIHPSSIMSRHVTLGTGNIICAGVVIDPAIHIGNHCHINNGSTIGHDTVMNNYVTIMPGSRVSGNVIIKSYSTLGAGSITIQGLTIEENVYLGAGTVVTKETEPNSLYIGVPARKVKNLDEPETIINN